MAGLRFQGFRLVAKRNSDDWRRGLTARGGAKIWRRVEKQTPSILRIRIHRWPVFSEVYVDF